MNFMPIDYIAALAAAVMLLGPLSMAPAYSDRAPVAAHSAPSSSPR